MLVRLTMIYPNELFGHSYIRNYNTRFDAASPSSPIPIQFPPVFTTASPELEVYAYHAHRGPASVQCASPAICSLSSHRIPLNPFFKSAGSPVDSDASHIGSAGNPSSSESTSSGGSFYTPPASPESLSPTSISPSRCNALVPTYSSWDGWLALDSVLGDPLLRTLVRIALGSELAYHLPSADNDVLPHLDNGTMSYTLRPAICRLIGDSLDRIADFVHCAATGHNPWFLGIRPEIPVFIPHAVLDQLGSRMPGISLFRMYSTANIHQMLFTDRDSAINYLRLAMNVYHYYLHWIANSMRISVEFGYHTAMQWGAPLSMSQTEWIHRITRHFVYGGYKSVEKLMSHQLLRNEMNFACASLLVCDPEIRLLSISRGDDEYLTIWPLAEVNQDVGDRVTHAILGQLEWSVEDLNRIVRDNEPVVLEDDAESDVESADWECVDL